MVKNMTSKYFQKLKPLFFYDKFEKELIKKNKKGNKERSFNNQTILFQCIDNYFYVLLFSFLINELKDKKARRTGIISVPLIITKSQYLMIFPILIKFILYRLEIIKLKKIYRAIGIDNFVYHNQFDMFLNFKILRKSLSVYLNLKSKKHLQKLEIKGLKVGDLIIDSYIRFYTHNGIPKLKLNSFWLFKVIYDSFSIFNFHSNFHKKIKVSKAFFTMSVYNTHGIPARVYTNAGIDVFVAGGFAQLFKKLDPEFHYSMQKDHTKFKDDFNILFSDNERINGEKRFAERFDGIDDTGYIDNIKAIGGFNTYDRTSIQSIQMKLDGVIFLHDFYDAHKIYGETIFSDFYEWAVFTFDLIRKHKLNIGIKPHPHNFIKLSSKVVDKLKIEYSDLNWIDKYTSNISIFKSGIKFGISHNGSVLSELAFFGITPICCYENRTSSFDFVYQANSIKEYKKYILGANNLSMKNRDQLGAFYYMNHILNKSDYEVKSTKIIGVNIKGVNRFKVKSSDFNILNT